MFNYRRIALSITLTLFIVAGITLTFNRAASAQAGFPLAPDPNADLNAPAGSEPQTTPEHRAALVVRFDDETVASRCVSFTEAEISGYDLLARSGLDVVATFNDMGAAVCKIEETGCPEDNCFCESPSTYWAYWHLEDEAWAMAQSGASDYQVSDGDVEGWSWGADEPPVITFDEICTQPPADTADAASPSDAALPSGYVIFGVITVGALVGLVFFLRRRN